jgi:hypothetical protein
MSRGLLAEREPVLGKSFALVGDDAMRLRQLSRSMDEAVDMHSHAPWTGCMEEAAPASQRKWRHHQTVGAYNFNYLLIMKLALHLPNHFMSTSFSSLQLSLCLATTGRDEAGIARECFVPNNSGILNQEMQYERWLPRHLTLFR